MVFFEFGTKGFLEKKREIFWYVDDRGSIVDFVSDSFFFGVRLTFS